MTIAKSTIEPERLSFDSEDGQIRGWRWRHDGKPALLFCHATGFCASVYKQMLQQLSASFDIHAIDMRGHGKTTLPADASSLRSWDIYASDINAYLNGQECESWFMAGHSMGAGTATMAARGRGDVKALLLIEPVAMPLWYSLVARTPIWPLLIRRSPMVRQAMRRRASWSDREAAYASYARKPIFSGWAPGVLADYLEDGLTEKGDSVVLSCRPDWEAATFSAQANDVWGAAAAVEASLLVIAANHPGSTVWPFARKRFRRLGHLEEVDGVGHLLPMERPQLAADLIARAFAADREKH